jgi:uncharacterized alpha-E superfamily protein
MLCRVAENLFWLGRYVERAVAVARLIDVTAHLELDASDPDARDVDFWTPLLGLAEWPRAPGAALDRARMVDARQHLAVSEDNPNSLVSCIRHARVAARGIRESISTEMWEQLNRQYLAVLDSRPSDELAEDPHGFFKRVLEGLLLVQGLADATLAHDEAWHFICLGRYLERADNVARVLQVQAHLLLAGVGAESCDDDVVRWLAVLRSCGAAEAYARYYALQVDPPRVVEFLLLNPVFPQSVRFSLRCALAALEQVATGQADSGGTPVAGVRSLGLLSAQLQYAAVDEILERGLGPFLTDVEQRIGLTSDQVALTFFRSHTRPDRHMPVARAAELMAAQQQQTRLGRC